MTIQEFIQIIKEYKETHRYLKYKHMKRISKCRSKLKEIHHAVKHHPHYPEY